MPGVVNQLNQPMREPIHLKSCSLYPPNPHAPLPTTRERPLGCKTVFVGGLTEHVTGTNIQFCILKDKTQS